jgi:hypothetical protein
MFAHAPAQARVAAVPPMHPLLQGRLTAHESVATHTLAGLSTPGAGTSAAAASSGKAAKGSKAGAKGKAAKADKAGASGASPPAGGPGPGAWQGRAQPGRCCLLALGAMTCHASNGCRAAVGSRFKGVCCTQQSVFPYCKATLIAGDAAALAGLPVLLLVDTAGCGCEERQEDEGGCWAAAACHTCAGGMRALAGRRSRLPCRGCPAAAQQLPACCCRRQQSQPGGGQGGDGPRAEAGGSWGGAAGHWHHHAIQSAGGRSILQPPLWASCPCVLRPLR